MLGCEVRGTRLETKIIYNDASIIYNQVAGGARVARESVALEIVETLGDVPLPNALGLEKMSPLMRDMKLQPRSDGEEDDRDEWIPETNPIHVVVRRAMHQLANTRVAREK